MVGIRFAGWCGSAEYDVTPFTPRSQVLPRTDTFHNQLVTQEATQHLASPVHTTHLASPVHTTHTTTARLSTTYTRHRNYHITVRQWKSLGKCLIILLLLIISGIETNPGPNINHLKICHVNMNSITSKIDELSIFVDANNIDVLLVSETKLDDSIHPSLYELPDFHTPYLNNRNRDGGGTAIYTRTNLAVKRLKNFELEGEDWVWAKVSVNGKSIIIWSLYLPPGLTVDRLEEFNSRFIESIALANSLSPLGIFILGDLNTGIIFLKSTPNMTPRGDASHSGITPFDIKLSHTLDTLELTQLITSPTRITDTVANLRDLAITDNTDMVTDTGTLSSFGKMDHLPIYLSTSLPATKSTVQTRTIWDYSKLEADKLTRLIQNQCSPRAHQSPVRPGPGPWALGPAQT